MRLREITYLYHATDAENLTAIAEQGLTPNTDREPTFDGYPIDGRLYVAKTREGVSFYADILSKEFDKDVCILRFPASVVRTKRDDFGNPGDLYTTEPRRARSH